MAKGKVVMLTMEAHLVMGKEGYKAGTSCQGYLPQDAKYKEIVKVFGMPQVIGSGDLKMKVEWIGQLNGKWFTIYDYKCADGVALKGITDWHIGGYDVDTARLVYQYFKKSR